MKYIEQIKSESFFDEFNKLSSFAGQLFPGGIRRTLKTFGNNILNRGQQTVESAVIHPSAGWEAAVQHRQALGPAVTPRPPLKPFSQRRMNMNAMVSEARLRQRSAMMRNQRMAAEAAGNQPATLITRNAAPITAKSTTQPALVWKNQYQQLPVRQPKVSVTPVGVEV